MTGIGAEDGPPRRVTIKDVARRAGVSPAAVSLAVNGRPGLSPATRRRVLDAAEALRWAPDPLARTMARRSVTASDAIGVALPGGAGHPASRQLSGDLLAGIAAVLAPGGWSVLPALTDGAAGAPEDRLLTWWQAGRITGAVIADLRIDGAALRWLADAGLPAVVIGRTGPGGPFPVVRTDDEAVADAAVRWLAALGHRHIGYVGGDSPLWLGAARARALRAACARAGLAPPRTVAADPTTGRAARATRALLSAPRPPTAIVHDDSSCAAAGLAVAHEMGVRVPHELSVLAWYDSDLCRLPRPSLTALTCGADTLGGRAARTLLALLHGLPTPEPTGTEGRLRQRNSAGPAAPR
ncbi:LacI family DNA-binding transcriptional regulator [Actinacidiphila alni]|uniref:LacI family DNA-binding transcriptional regulator n=1 Tax=Actinacidiphila alni TaxID=380248 RepID=UPI003454464F